LERQEGNSKKSITIGVLVVFTVSTLGVTLAFAEDYDTLFNKAVSLGELGKYEEAIIYWDKVLETHPEDTDALYNKAVELYNLGRNEEAIIYYDKVLEINPNYTAALYNNGVILSDLSRYEEAISYYERVLEINPTHPDANNNLVVLREYLETLREYLETYQINEEDDSESSWSPLIGVIIGGIIVASIPWIRNRKTKNHLKKKKLFQRPSFFVKKIKFASFNTTYAVLFDNERILFVHAQKISKAPKESTVEEIINMSEQNFQIPMDEITSIVLEENTEGPNGVRAGILHVESEEYNGEFDIMAGQDLQECQETVTNFWPTYGALSRH